MKNSVLGFAAAAICILPMTTVAHPGHFDNAPFAHSVAHGILYLLPLLALCLLAKQHGARLLRFIAARKHSRR